VGLSPLFRYSDWRDAWVLRGIGERHGPVLIRAAPELADPYERPVARLGRRGAAAQLSINQRASRLLAWRGSGRLAILAVAVVLAAAAVGFTVAHSGARGDATRALTGHASAGPLRLSVPSDWRHTSSPVVAQLGLADAITLAPAGSRGEILVIGHTVTSDPQLLPRALLASLPSTPTPQTVSLGPASFYRYLSLAPIGGDSPASVYAMSSTVGTVLGVCIAPKTRFGFTSSCEQLLATLRLSHGTALPPGPIPGYASALNRVIGQLNAARTTAGSRLLTAPAATAQAHAADALSAAYTQAAAAITHLDAGPAGAANSALSAALTRNAAGYRALGLAAALQDSAAYSLARGSLKQAAGALISAYSGLDAFGYTVS
jgi:hypothetical protein